MTDEKKLMAAIVELREHMKLSQAAFAANVFKKTLPTQQRYERVRPPIGAHLAVLVHVAREYGRDDLAELFKIAAIETVDPKVRDLILEPATKTFRKRAS